MFKNELKPNETGGSLELSTDSPNIERIRRYCIGIFWNIIDIYREQGTLIFSILRYFQRFISVVSDQPQQ